MLGFSIIICTYNPNREIFIRLLNAISNFSDCDLPLEIFIVDNNSTDDLASEKIVLEFLQKHEIATLISEPNPGLTEARITGIKSAKYDWVIFFDDDNEPQANYLIEVSKIINEYKGVGAWGPGNVIVEYENNFYEKKFSHVKELFQQRSENFVRTSNKNWWQDCYPAGTGLVVRKDIGVVYSKYVTSGMYSLTDRKGKSLCSGGDLQLVLTAIKMGFSAGVHPALKVTHVIGKERLSTDYLKNLSFGTAAANVPGHLQVWNDLDPHNFAPPSNQYIFKQAYHHLKVKLHQDGIIKTEISFCALLGAWSALYKLNPIVKPSFFYKLFCKFLRVS